MAKQGRPYKPTDADRLFVDRAKMAGATDAEIAGALRLTRDTLRKHFRYELMTARARLKNKAVYALDENLDAGNLEAAKFVLSRIAGWTERQDHTLSDPDGGPIKNEITVRVVGAKDGRHSDT